MRHSHLPAGRQVAEVRVPCPPWPLGLWSSGMTPHSHCGGGSSILPRSTISDLPKKLPRGFAPRHWFSPRNFRGVLIFPKEFPPKVGGSQTKFGFRFQRKGPGG